MLDARRQNELEDTVKQSLFIYIAAKESFQYWDYLNFPKSDEEKEYLRYSKDFEFIAHIMWRNTVIEISKLLSDSKGDRYSLVRLLSKFGPSGEYSKAPLPAAKLTEWSNFRRIFEAEINQVKFMRDVIYSHTDHPDKRAAITGVTVEAYRKLLFFSEDIIRTIYMDLLDCDLETTTFVFDAGVFPRMIAVLSEEKQTRLDDILVGFTRKK